MSRGVTLRALLLAGVLTSSGCATATAPSSHVAIGRQPSNALPVGADAPLEAPAGEIATVAPAVFTGSPPPSALPPPQLLSPPTPVASGTGVWAAIIGIDDYPGTRHDLRDAGNDAADVDAALARYRVPPEQRLRLGGGAASAASIRRSLQWLTTKAGPDATAVFFYAGHVRKQGGHEVLVGADGATVSDAEVAALLRPLRASRSWIVIAGCYGGGFTEVLGPGRILTAAAPADELAYESPQLGRSYLVEYLVRRAMLEGKADTSVESAFAWAAAELRRDHPNRVPVQFDELAGNLSLGQPLPAVPPRSANDPSSGTSRAAPPATTTTTAPPRRQQCLIRIGTAVRCD